MPPPTRTSKDFPPGQVVQAGTWLDAMLAPDAPAAPKTLEDWASDWITIYVEPFHPPNTVRGYTYALRQLESQYAVALGQIRTSVLQGIVGRLAARLDPHSVQMIVGVWRRCMDAAIDDELLVRNPAKKLITPKTVPRDKPRHVTAADVAALWPLISGQRFEAAFALLLGCGLRIGEVLGLRWENVDMAGRRIWVKDQFTNGHWRTLPKGRNPHWVRLPSDVHRALVRHLNAQPEGSVLVMQSTYGTGCRARRLRRTEPRPWNDETVRKALVKLCERVDVDPFVPHAARHGLVTALLDGGAPLAAVAERVGHADTATTLKYAGRSDEGRELTDRLIDQYIGSVPEPAAVEDPAV